MNLIRLHLCGVARCVVLIECGSVVNPKKLSSTPLFCHSSTEYLPVDHSRHAVNLLVTVALHKKSTYLIQCCPCTWRVLYILRSNVRRNKQLIGFSKKFLHSPLLICLLTGKYCRGYECNCCVLPLERARRVETCGFPEVLLTARSYVLQILNIQTLSIQEQKKNEE